MPDEPRPVSCFLFEPERDTPRCVNFAFLMPDLVCRLKSVAYDQQTAASDHQPLIVELA
jgi:endonuclease/exonuclease/phosphatase family metal-dependent hydrolase